jgi:DNA-binding GntR family transcriptional regulator
MDTASDPKSQAERAYERLRSEILYGELMPGERLRAAELQDRFRLGLTPIREALMRLSTEGLVSAETHRGSRVSEATRESLADLMATRRDIERLCLVRAIAHGDAAWEAEIVASLHMLSRAPLPSPDDERGTDTHWETQHRRFHTALVAACGSDWLLRFWNVLTDHSERFRKMRAIRHREARAEVRDFIAEHSALANAVLARDSERAMRLMDQHLLATEKAVARFLAPEARTKRAAG